MDIPLSQLPNHYKVFPIKQGSKTRIIQEPLGELKTYQQSLLPFFSEYPFYYGCTARSGFSTVHNAAPHHGSRIVFKTDIESFYPSITLEHLLRNFDVAETKWQESAKRVVLSCLIPVGGRLCLPTGAPTSPILSNIAATDLDFVLLEIANHYGFSYTRYIDDLTFSGQERSTALSREVEAAINQHGFRWKWSKTDWFYPGADKKFEVTGVALLTEWSKYKVPKELRRLVRARLTNIARSGQEVLDKQTLGYLSYIKMVDITVYSRLINYLEERRTRYERPNRLSSSTEQALPSNAGDECHDLNEGHVQGSCQGTG